MPKPYISPLEAPSFDLYCYLRLTPDGRLFMAPLGTDLVDPTSDAWIRVETAEDILRVVGVPGG